MQAVRETSLTQSHHNALLPQMGPCLGYRCEEPSHSSHSTRLSLLSDHSAPPNGHTPCCPLHTSHFGFRHGRDPAGHSNEEVPSSPKFVGEGNPVAGDVLLAPHGLPLAEPPLEPPHTPEKESQLVAVRLELPRELEVGQGAPDSAEQAGLEVLTGEPVTHLLVFRCAAWEGRD